MCGRFALSTLGKEEKFQKFFMLDAKTQVPKFEDFNIPPTGEGILVTMTGAELIVETASFGLIPFWRNDEKLRLHNIKAETILEKNWGNDYIQKHRCVIPATGFFEWKKQDDKSKQPFFIKPIEGDFFGFAGVFSENKSTKTKYFSILTTCAKDEMAQIHTRMPIILNQKYLALYLSQDKSKEEIIKSIKQSRDYEIYPVDKKVATTKYHDESLIKR